MGRKERRLKTLEKPSFSTSLRQQGGSFLPFKKSGEDKSAQESDIKPKKID